MKAWNFKVKSNPKEVGNKLESALGSVDGLVYNMDHDKNDSVTFKVRKRALFVFGITTLNNIIVNGKLSTTGTENDTEVEIYFTQHILAKLVIFANTLLALGFLIAIISGISDNSYLFIGGGILLALIIVIGFGVQKSFDRNVKEYKVLISKILEL